MGWQAACSLGHQYLLSSSSSSSSLVVLRGPTVVSVVLVGRDAKSGEATAVASYMLTTRPPLMTATETSSWTDASSGGFYVGVCGKVSFSRLILYDYGVGSNRMRFDKIMAVVTILVAWVTVLVSVMSSGALDLSSTNDGDCGCTMLGRW